MKPWYILKYANPNPSNLVVCGECAHLWPVRDLIEIVRPIDSYNCSECGKNAGNYFHAKHKEAA